MGVIARFFPHAVITVTLLAAFCTTATGFYRLVYTSLLSYPHYPPPEKASLGLAESVYGLHWFPRFGSAFIIVFSLQSPIHTCFCLHLAPAFLVCLYLAPGAIWNSTVT